jgi:hypothetical protein
VQFHGVNAATVQIIYTTKYCMLQSQVPGLWKNVAGFRDMNFGDMLVIDGVLCALVTSEGHSRRERGT